MMLIWNWAYLKRIRLRSLPPRGKETKVISTPGSTWATHSFGSFSSMNTTGSTRRPLTDFIGVASPLELDIPLSLASISFPQVVLGVVELELPVLLYDHLNRSESASDSPELLLSRLWAAPGAVHGLQCRYAPDAFNAMSFSWNYQNTKHSENEIWLTELSYNMLTWLITWDVRDLMACCLVLPLPVDESESSGWLSESSPGCFDRAMHVSIF